MGCRHKYRGFNLLEVIIGAILLSIVGLSSAALWKQHQRMFQQSRNRIVAEFLLTSEMERVIAGGFSGLQAIADEDPIDIQVGRRVGGVLSNTVYTTDVSLRSNPDDNIRRAEVSVSFTEKDKIVVIVAENDFFYTQ